MAIKDTASRIFSDFMRERGFPSVGAKSTLINGDLRIIVAGDLGCDDADGQILTVMQAMPREQSTQNGLVPLVVLFPATPELTERGFEGQMWDRLQALHDRDSADFVWDWRVSSDPSAANFGVSIGGAGFYVAGLHPGATRIARRAPMAAIVFDPHAQFRALKSVGTAAKLRHAVRRRDVATQGGTNPMPVEQGAGSEAREYGGRVMRADGARPFQAGQDVRNA